MADATSSGTGSSGHSERSRPRIHRRVCAATNPCPTNSDPSLAHLQPQSEESLGKAVEILQSNQEDRETAKKAVAIVLRATRKRGFKGAVALCTEVTSLLEQNRRLERTVSLLKRGVQNHETLKNSPSLSNQLSRTRRRATESKANQIRPVLVNRSTSPLIKEVHVKSANNQTTQVDIPCFDGSCRLAKESSEGYSAVEEKDKNEVQYYNEGKNVMMQGNMTKAEEKWSKLQEENSLLKTELLNVKNELESLKKKGILPPIVTEGQSVASKATPTSSIKHLDQTSKSQNILPESSIQRLAESINPEVELPHIPQAKPLGQTQDSKTNVHQHRKKGFRPFSSPVKVSPNLPSQRQPIRPVEMYSHCKCPSCMRVLCEEANLKIWSDKNYTIDKKSPKQPEILPIIGDHVVVRSHLTGKAKFF